MIECKCLDKYRDNNGKIYGYKLQDLKGKIINIYTDDLKDHIRNGRVNVTNLTLTSDNRLVNSEYSEEKQAATDLVDFKIKSSMTKAKVIGSETHIINTFCGHSCYLVKAGENKYNLYIPDDVTILNRPNMDNEKQFSYKLSEILGRLSSRYRQPDSKENELKVIGGHNVTDMHSLFSKITLKRLDLTKFNTAKAKNMSNMFEFAVIDELIFGGEFTTANVINMCKMFAYCKIGYRCKPDGTITKTGDKIVDLLSKATQEYKSIITPLNGFDTRNVTNMQEMFNSAAIFVNFNDLDTRNVTNMNSMFYSYTGLRLLDLNHFDLSKARYLNKTFAYCSVVTIDISSWKVNENMNINDMFKGCRSEIKYTDQKFRREYFKGKLNVMSH